MVRLFILSAAGLLATVAMPAPLRAQAPSRSLEQDAAADSATVARRAFRDAQTAPATRAAELLQRATAAWPAQPTYWLARARLGVRTADHAVVRQAIRAIVHLQQAPALRRDSLIQHWMVQHGGVELEQHVARSAAPVSASIVWATVDSSVFVEGATIRSTGQLFLTSLRQGTVLQCDTTGNWRNLNLSRDPRVEAVFAVRTAPDDSTLWIGTAPHVLRAMSPGTAGAPSGVAAIARVRMSDGSVLEWHPLPSPHAAHVPGDLLVLPSGDVLVSDSETARLYLWQARERTWHTIAHPGFRSPQGLAYIPEAGLIVVADYSHGLYSLRIGTWHVQRLADAPTTGVLGLDGLAWHGGSLYAVQNGGVVPQVLGITLTANHAAVQSVRVVDRQPTLAPEPTSILSSARGLYVVGNSPWSLFDGNGLRTSEPAPATTSILWLADTVLGDNGKQSVATTPARLLPGAAAASCKRSVAPAP